VCKEGEECLDQQREHQLVGNCRTYVAAVCKSDLTEFGFFFLKARTGNGNRNKNITEDLGLVCAQGEARCSVDGLGAVLKGERSQVRVPMRSLFCFQFA
jgi:hypothetical protein